MRYHKETESVLAHETAMKPLQRPDTAGMNTAAFSSKLNLENISLATISLEGGDRPATHAIRFRSSVPGNVLPLVNPERVEPHSEHMRLQHFSVYQERCPVGRVLTLNLLDTWGDPHYAGLTSIEASLHFFFFHSWKALRSFIAPIKKSKRLVKARSSLLSTVKN